MIPEWTLAESEGGTMGWFKSESTKPLLDCGQLIAVVGRYPRGNVLEMVGCSADGYAHWEAGLGKVVAATQMKRVHIGRTVDVDFEISRRIKRHMQGRMTQEQLAAAVGLRQSDISKRLSGKIVWKASVLRDVAVALGVSIGVLFCEES